MCLRRGRLSFYTTAEVGASCVPSGFFDRKFFGNSEKKGRSYRAATRMNTLKMLCGLCGFMGRDS